MADTPPLPADDCITIACKLRISRAERFGARVVGQNDRVRKLLIGLAASVSTVVVGVVGTDFGAAIYAEFHWARAVRAANDLPFDPWVGILGFPFVEQAIRRGGQSTTRAAWVAGRRSNHSPLARVAAAHRFGAVCVVRTGPGTRPRGV